MSNNLDAKSMSQSELTETAVTHATKLLNEVFGFCAISRVSEAIY